MRRADSSSSDIWTPNSEDSPKKTLHTSKVYLVQAKLSPCQISEYIDLIESSPLFSLSHHPEDADVIVTAVRMKQRLTRHVPWDIAKERAIVKPEWLVKSAQEGRPVPCGEYAAMNVLHDETVEHCPDASPSTSGSISTPSPPASSVDRFDPNNLDYTSHYSCCRASPLKCVNEDLVQQFSIIRRSRELDSQDMQALAYERTIAVLKAFPDVITDDNLDTVRALPYIGQKSISKITEFVRTGHISEAYTISLDARYQTLVTFNKIYGVGPTNARKLYDTLGLRTLDDVAIYHGVKLEEEQRSLHEPIRQSKRRTGPPPTLEIGRAIALVSELDEKIPREEVEEMRDTVMKELSHIQTGCVSTIVGGYRRGKSMSNDVDIVISHKEKGIATGLCKKLVKRLYEKGYVKNLMHLSSFHAPTALRTSNWDTLEKALTVFILPGKTTHRRLDLIFAEPEVYWAAVVGWTGSKMFERDLRKWAKDKKGLKFDSSGITRRYDSKFIPAWSEREVFEILGLEYVPPELRNADA